MDALNAAPMNENTDRLIASDFDFWLSDILINIGILPNLIGHYQIKYAVFVAAHNIQLLSIKDIYEIVARTCSTFSKNVERNIRNALKVSFNAGYMININKLLKTEAVKGNNHLLSNSQFISLLAHYLNQKFCPPPFHNYQYSSLYC